MKPLIGESEDEPGCTCANHGVRICEEPNPVWDMRCPAHPDRWDELLPHIRRVAPQARGATQAEGAALEAQRNEWIKRYNRLEAAVAKHRRKAPEWVDTDDEELHAAHDRILRDAAKVEPA